MSTFTRRQALILGAASVAALSVRADATTRKVGTMPKVFLFAPHPDDETLSMGLAATARIAAGYEVHLVSMNRGGALGVANTLNGGPAGGPPAACTLAEHPYIHNPAREGYAPFTVPMIGDARIKEARSSLGAMAMLPPTGTPGTIFHHDANLPDFYGNPGSTSSTAPVTPEGIAAAKVVIKQYVDAYPNSFFYTMSQTDNHPDHAACGYALRELKNDDVNIIPGTAVTYHDALVNARFFVSRLYWDYTANPDVAAQHDLKWFDAGPRKAEYDALLKGRVINTYKAWNPASGAYAVGYHQVAGQFLANFGPSVSVGNLWHA